MKHLAIFLALCTMSMVCSAADQLFEVKVYQGSGGPDVKMDVYLPGRYVANSGTFVVLCPGGGYEMVSLENEGRLAAQWLNSIGVAAGVLHYRLPEGKYEVPLQDALKAVETAKENMEKWGVSRVGIMGFSAGGHLASTVMTQYSSEKSRPDFGVLFYPVITMDPSFTHLGSREHLIGADASEELTRRFSSELNVTSDTPPTFIVHTTTDNVVPVKNSLVFYEALSEKGVPVEMHIYPTNGHGWGFQWGFTYRGELYVALTRWLKDTVPTFASKKNL